MENKCAKDLLPLGSIVILKNGKRKMMITGRYQIKSGTNELFDYLGCLYPEGIINEKLNFLFNNDNIDQIIFKGFSDEEDTKFKEELQILLNNRKEK